jgi:hypothetical protein
VTTAKSDALSAVRLPSCLCTFTTLVLTSQDLSKPQCRRCIKARLQCGGPHGIAIIQYGQSRPDQPDDLGPAPSSLPKAITTTPTNIQQPDPGIYPALSLSHDEIFTTFTLLNFLPNSNLPNVAPGTMTTQSFLALASNIFVRTVCETNSDSVHLSIGYRVFRYQAPG